MKNYPEDAERGEPAAYLTPVDLFYEILDSQIAAADAVKRAEARLSYERERYERRTLRAASETLKSWGFPVSAPFRLFSVWLNELAAKLPQKPGKFDKFIALYEEGGFDATDKYLAARSAAPFNAASAYTALARKLALADRKGETLIAAQKAWDAEPKAFRAKWRAFRMAEAGETEEAALVLQTIEPEIEFSATESRQSKNIYAQALLEREEKIYKNWGEKFFARVYPAAVAPALRARENGSSPFEAARVLKDSLEEKFPGAPGLKAALALLAAGNGVADIPSLCKYAVANRPTPVNIRAAYNLALKNGQLLLACGLIDDYARSLSHLSSDYDLDFLEYLLDAPVYKLGAAYALEIGAKKPRKDYVEGRICYVLHNSLPYSSGGYATRSHGVAAGLARAGYEVFAVTRPGYPLDIGSEEAESTFRPEGEIIDEVRYERLAQPRRRDYSMREYTQRAAAELEKLFARLKPELVIAASNHETGLSALLAARNLGVPFIYEVRGLWEITHASRDAKFASSPIYAIHKLLETEVCRRADHVFTLTNGLRNELISRGAPAERISLAPNACDPALFQPIPRDETLAASLGIPPGTPVVGYVGTFVVYEGLDDLARACARLKQSGRQFRLLLVGNENASAGGMGEIAADIRRTAREGGFEDWLITPGRVPHEEVARYYSLIDIAPFPRKPWPVCRIVSPMKPLEALAMEKAILVSDVEALREMIEPEKTGLVFKAGDVDDLAAKLATLIDNPAERRKLGKNGRAYVIENRAWDKIIDVMRERIDSARSVASNRGKRL